jgi:hypothetical protein
MFLFLGTARKSWFRWRAWRTRRSGEIFYLDNLLTKSYCLSKTVEWNNTICRKHNSWLVTGFVNRLTRQVPLVEQELLTLPEHLSSSQVFSGVCVTRSLFLCVCFVVRCLFFCTFSFGYCIVCSSSIYGFWLPLWYLQTLQCEIQISNTNIRWP